MAGRIVCRDDGHPSRKSLYIMNDRIARQTDISLGILRSVKEAYCHVSIFGLLKHIQRAMVNAALNAGMRFRSI